LQYGKVIIFDLFDTILKDVSYEYRKGIEWLKNEILSKGCDPEEVQHIADQYKQTYMKNRTTTYKEASHLKQLEYFKEKIGFSKELPLNEIEYNFFSISRITRPLEGATELLHWLKEQECYVYIMSNTIFSAATIKRHLETLGLSGYFDEVYTSSDCGYRKPGYKFFNSVFKEIRKNLSVKKHEVIFIGNSLEKDMLGAKKFGFTPLWLSSNTSGFGEYIADCARVSDLFMCRDYLESNYIRIAGVPKNYSVADGIGNRIVVYMQGCDLHCRHCHNQNTWDFTGGKIYSIRELVTQILSHLSRAARNVTISGGEPLSQPKPLLAFLDALRCADIDVCLYTGYDFEKVPDVIKDKIHYLKTGTYVHELKTTEKGFYGSTNQKFWEKVNGETWIQKI
jgi:FMN phosphatase YigB (HAD superfamily)